MPKPYQRRTSTEWLAIIEDQQHSGLSASQYCDQNQLSSASFYKWKQRYSTKSSQTPKHNSNDFLDLSALTSTSGRWQITLSLGDGVELNLSPG